MCLQRPAHLGSSIRAVPFGVGKLGAFWPPAGTGRPFTSLSSRPGRTVAAASRGTPSCCTAVSQCHFDGMLCPSSIGLSPRCNRQGQRPCFPIDQCCLFAMMIHHEAGHASRLNESSYPLPRCLRPRLHAASCSPSLRHAGPVRAADKVYVKPAGVQQQWIRQNLRTKPCK